MKDLSEETKWILLLLFCAVVCLTVGFFMGKDLNEAKIIRLQSDLQFCNNSIPLRESIAASEESIKMTEACFKDMTSLLKIFTPEANCSLVIVTENYKIETCSGERLYEQIQDEKRMIDSRTSN